MNRLHGPNRALHAILLLSGTVPALGFPRRIEAAGMLDLTRAVVVAPRSDEKAVSLLVEEVGRRTGIRWAVGPRLPDGPGPVIVVGRASDLSGGDARIGAMLGRIVSILGHECVVTTSGHEALTRADALQPEIGIVDLKLTDLSGYELARRLRAAHGGRMFLAAVTGWEPAKDPREAFEAGFDHHVVKPVGLDLVQQLLECAHERLGIT